VVGEGRPVLAVLSRSDRRLNKALRLHIPSDVPPGPGGLLGLELEFSVRSVRGGQVHFGSLIHRLALDGAALDPGDPNAYRCSWGGVITSDGAEAEIATPPVCARPGFTARLQAWAQTGEAELRRAAPRGIELDGYSAHFSAAMPAKLNDRVCRLYAETFAADLMLLMNRADSPGLLVRPRPGRTELCGEFIENEPLAAAAAFVAGSTRACAAAVRRRSARTALPPRLDVRLARAVHRYGWYVDRGAFGTDLHAASRRALLRRASGGTISAQTHLELAWAAARQALADDAAASDLQAAEAMVTGSLPLPAEHDQPDGAPGGQPGGDVRFPLDGTVVPDMPRPSVHVRPGFVLRPVAATWDFTVFAASGPARRAYACIPRDSLPGFAAALEEGALDDAIAAYLALSTRRRMLSAPQQTTRPGLYDRMGAPAELLAPERDPQTGHQESGEPGAKRTLARPGKRNRQDRQAPQKEQEAPQKDREAPRKAARSRRSEKTRGRGGQGKRQRSPADQPDDAVSRAVKAAVKPGLLTFNPPATMVQGRRERVEVGIARSPELREALTTGLRGRGKPQFEGISTSPYMGVELQGAAFEVTSFSPPEQLVAPMARWEFDVRPYRAGHQSLTLCVSLRIDSPTITSGRIGVPVLEREIQVQVDIVFGACHFLAKNWQWLIATILGVCGALATWITLFR
jgi:hypothetical protein